MDRFSIIKQIVVNDEVIVETNACGEEDCECINEGNDEKLFPKKGRLLDATFIAIAVSLGAMMLILITKGSIGNMRIDKNVVSSCGPGSDYLGRLADKKLPEDEDNRTICPHQQGALCENSNSKRKTLKFHRC